MELWISVSDIQDYFEYIFKKRGEDIDKPSVQTYVKILKIELHLKLKMGIVLKLLGTIKNKMTKEKMVKMYPHLEITEVILVHGNIVNNDNQQDSRVFYTFVQKKPFGSLLEVSPTNHIFLKTFNSEYDKIKVWFTDQNSQPLEMKDRINLTMVIKWRLYV